MACKDLARDIGIRYKNAQMLARNKVSGAPCMANQIRRWVGIIDLLLKIAFSLSHYQITTNLEH